MPDANQIVISLVPQTLTVIRHLSDALQSSTRAVVETMVSDFLCRTLSGHLSPELVNVAEESGVHRHEAWCRVYRAYVRRVHTPSGSNPVSKMTLCDVARIDPGFRQIVQRSKRANSNGAGPRRGTKSRPRKVDT